MTITIGKQQFEQYVPAFRDATSEIFDALTSYLSIARAEVEEYVGQITAEEETQVIDAAARLATLIACRRALPHLDLVLTPTGFGVVSNQNVAPASRERVAALANRLRIDESMVHDILTFSLLRTSWRNGARAQERISSLLWCPTICRRLGIRSDKGEEVYEEEFQTILPDIRSAEQRLAEEISLELLQKIIDDQRHAPGGELALYAFIQERSRKIISVMLTDTSKKNAQAVRRMMDELLDYVHRFKEQIPEYNGSSTARAHEFPRYENEKEDSTFFFG